MKGHTENGKFHPHNKSKKISSDDWSLTLGGEAQKTITDDYARIRQNRDPIRNKKRIAIVGSSLRKGLKPRKFDSYNKIESILKKNGCNANNCVIVSGHSPAGGIDIWAEEIARKKNIPTDIYPARVNNMSGYYARNKQIAGNSDILYNIVVKSPSSYCNHHRTYGHQQSGGCMTEVEAKKKGVKTNLELVDRV